MCHTVLQLCVSVEALVDVRKFLMVGFVKVNVPVGAYSNWRLVSMKEKVLWTCFILTCQVCIIFSHILWKESCGLNKMNATLQNALMVIED